LGVDVQARQHELHRDLVWDAGGTAGDQAAAEAELGLRIEEVGSRGGDREIAELNEHVGAADAIARDRRDERFVHRHADPRHALPELGIAWRVGEVGADREGAVAGAGDDGAAVVALLEALESVA
jgi:hypothetical protein